MAAGMYLEHYLDSKPIVWIQCGVFVYFFKRIILYTAVLQSHGTTTTRNILIDEQEAVSAFL